MTGNQKSAKFSEIFFKNIYSKNSKSSFDNHSIDSCTLILFIILLSTYSEV